MLEESILNAQSDEMSIIKKDFENEFICDFDISNIEFVTVNFSKCGFYNVHFNNCDFSNCTFMQSYWKQSRIIESKGDGANFFESTFKKFEINNSSFFVQILQKPFLNIQCYQIAISENHLYGKPS